MKFLVMLLVTACSNGVFANKKANNGSSSTGGFTLESINSYGYGSLYSSFADGSGGITLGTGSLDIPPSVYVAVSSPSNIDPGTLIPSSFSCSACTISDVAPIYDSGNQLLGFLINLSSNTPGAATISLDGVQTTDGNPVTGNVAVTFIGDASGNTTPALSLDSIPTTPQASLTIEVPAGFNPVVSPLNINSIVCENCTVTAITGTGPYEVKIISSDVSLPAAVSVLPGTFTDGTNNTVVSNIVNIDFSSVVPALMANTYAGYGTLESSYLGQPVQSPQVLLVNQPTAGLYFQVMSPTNIDSATLVPGSFSCGSGCSVSSVDIYLDANGNVSGFIVHVNAVSDTLATLTSTGVQDLNANSLPITPVDLSFVSESPALSPNKVPSSNVADVSLYFDSPWVPNFTVNDPSDGQGFFTCVNCTVLSISGAAPNYTVNVQAIDTSLPTTLMTNVGAFSNAGTPNANTSNILNIDFSQVPITAKYFYGAGNNPLTFVNNPVLNSSDLNFLPPDIEATVMLKFSGSIDKTSWSLSDFTCLGDSDGLSQVTSILYSDATTILVGVNVVSPNDTVTFAVNNSTPINGLNGIPVTLDIDGSSSSLDTKIFLSTQGTEGVLLKVASPLPSSDFAVVEVIAKHPNELRLRYDDTIGEFVDNFLQCDKTIDNCQLVAVIPPGQSYQGTTSVNPRLILTAGAAGNTYTTAQGLMKLMNPNLSGTGGTPTNIVTIPWELKSTRLSLDLQKAGATCKQDTYTMQSLINGDLMPAYRVGASAGKVPPTPPFDTFYYRDCLNPIDSTMTAPPRISFLSTTYPIRKISHPFYLQTEKNPPYNKNFKLSIEAVTEQYLKEFSNLEIGLSPTATFDDLAYKPAGNFWRGYLSYKNNIGPFNFQALNSAFSDGINGSLPSNIVSFSIDNKIPLYIDVKNPKITAPTKKLSFQIISPVGLLPLVATMGLSDFTYTGVTSSLSSITVNASTPDTMNTALAGYNFVYTVTLNMANPVVTDDNFEISFDPKALFELPPEVNGVLSSQPVKIKFRQVLSPSDLTFFRYSNDSVTASNISFILGEFWSDEFTAF